MRLLIRVPFVVPQIKAWLSPLQTQSDQFYRRRNSKAWKPKNDKIGRLQAILQGRALNHPYGLTIYKTFLFWSEFLESQINRLEVNESGAVNGPVTIFSDYSPLFELHVYDSSAQLRKSF